MLGVRGAWEIRRSAAIAVCAVPRPRPVVEAGTSPLGRPRRRRRPEPELALEEIGEFEEPIALTGAQDGCALHRASGRESSSRIRRGPGRKAGGRARHLFATSRPRERAACSRSRHEPEGDGCSSPMRASTRTPPGGGRSSMRRGKAGKSRRELLAVDHPNEVHWGGHVDFDDDGRLYFSTGEGGPVAPRPLVSQDPGLAPWQALPARSRC